MKKSQLEKIGKIANDFGLQTKIIKDGRISFELKNRSTLDIYPSMYVRISKKSSIFKLYCQKDSYISQYILSYKKPFKNLDEQLEYVYSYMFKKYGK